MKILVGGDFDKENSEQSENAQKFARLLGKEIIDQDHTLLTSCRTLLDRRIAESAANVLKEIGESIFMKYLAQSHLVV